LIVIEVYQFITDLSGPVKVWFIVYRTTTRR